MTNRDNVGIERHCAISCQCPTGDNVRSSIEGDACQRDNVTLEGRSGSKRRRTTYLPINVAASGTVDEIDRRVAGGRYRRTNLENKQSIRVSLRVKSKSASQLGGR